MFNLDDQMLMWKSEIEKTENLANDDVEELESHILDKINDLENEGYTLENAFNIAINKIGSNDLLSEEYKKVNTKLSAFQKITYGMIGFIGVNLIFEIANILALMISALFANKLLSSETNNIPVVNKIIELLIGEAYSNNLSVFALLLSIILSIGAISIILSKKRNIIISFIEIMEKSKSNKIYYFMLSVILPISMFCIPLMIRVITMNSIDSLYRWNIFSMVNLVNSASLVILIISFAKEISKRSSSNRYKLTILSGYIGVVLILDNTLPGLLSVIFVTLGITSTVFLQLAYVSISSLIIYLIVRKKSKSESNSNKRLNVGVIMLGIVLFNLLKAPVITRIISPEVYGEISFSISIIKIICIISLPCISYIYILFQNIINNNQKGKVCK